MSLGSTFSVVKLWVSSDFYTTLYTEVWNLISLFVLIINYATFIFRMLKLGYSGCTSSWKSIIFCFICSCLLLTFFFPSNSGSSEVLLLSAEGYKTVGNIDTRPCTNLELTGHCIAISTIVLQLNHIFLVVVTVRVYAAIFFKPLSSSTSDSSLLTNRFWGREWASSSVSYLDREQNILFVFCRKAHCWRH